MNQPIKKSEPTKAELIKINSQNLRGAITEEIESEARGKFSPESENLLKFHGIYQQKDRDRRPPSERKKGPKPFVLMVRGRIPGGRLNSQQWAAWDEASAASSGSLRLTSRQSIELHSVLKRDLKETIAKINAGLSTTTGSCGDVVRNVVQPVNPWQSPQLKAIDPVVDKISSYFEVQSNAYYEIFCDGKKIDSTQEPDLIYGKAYLPRKFKIAVTVEGNNSVDLFTNDLGIVAQLDQNNHIIGFFVFAGGGLGQSHSDPSTFARLADYLGWIPQEWLIPVSEAVIKVQRDYGNREDRSHARLKYLIDKRGLDWFREKVEKESGLSFQDKAFGTWNTPSYLGWQQGAQGLWSLGIHILSGRIIDTEGKPLKSMLRYLIEKYDLQVQITPQQDLVLLGIESAQKQEIDNFLKKSNIFHQSSAPVFESAMTCVALPLCSKAFAEAERAGPDLFTSIDRLLKEHSLEQRAPIVRISGCPNGCSRPFVAEFGLVGEKPNKYALYAGGDREGTRLAFKIYSLASMDDTLKILDFLFFAWTRFGKQDEWFGDFIFRIGKEKIINLINFLFKDKSLGVGELSLKANESRSL